MRLTKLHKDAFVRRVMQDVPHEDYQEQARKLLFDTSVAMLPPPVRALYDNPELRHWVPGDSVYVSQHNGYVHVLKPDRRGLQFPQDVLVKADQLHRKHIEQKKRREELEAKLRGVIASCQTLKTLKAALPEFVQYMPEDEAPLDRSVPALANVVTDFIRAGWPKDKKPPEVQQEPAPVAVH